MRAEIYNTAVETTEDCVTLIDPFKQHSFKRKAKFNINVGHDQYVVRTFTDKQSNKEYSLITDGHETRVLPMDISILKDTIKQIQDVAKNVYTHDYGEVWLNPFTMKVWVSGGDGGIMRWEGSPKKLAKMMEDGDLEDAMNEDEDLGFGNIQGITEEILEAECSPVLDNGEEDLEYISVAMCKDIGDYMEW